MARLHVLGEWHGPGERKTAERLRDDLPDEWDVIAGRQVPNAMGPVDIDLIVVGPHAVHVCEEKAWGARITTGEVSWYVNGEPRPDPSGQLGHACRVLAARLREKVDGWAQSLGRLPRGRRPVSGHVVLSHDRLVLDDLGDLGEDVVLRLADTADVLRARDAAFPSVLAPLRPRLMSYLLGLQQRSPEEHPRQILQFEILDKPDVRGDVRVYPARLPSGDNAFLSCIPVTGVPDLEEARRIATREHDALAALASKQRTWRVQSWFEWEGYLVTPVIVEMDGTSLGKLAATRTPEHDASGRVPPEVGRHVVHDAFAALAAVHAEGITHRALQLRSVEVTPDNRVRFRDFGRAHLPATATIAPALDDDHPSAAFRPPGTALAFLQPRDDVYSLALSLVQWLYGEAGSQPGTCQPLRDMLVRDSLSWSGRVC